MWFVSCWASLLNDGLEFVCSRPRIITRISASHCRRGLRCCCCYQPLTVAAVFAAAAAAAAVMCIIRLEDRLQPNIGFTLRHILVLFTRSTITQPTVNRFGWKLEHSVYIVGGWPWQILGAIRAVAIAGEPGEILFCFFVSRPRIVTRIYQRSHCRRSRCCCCCCGCDVYYSARR